MKVRLALICTRGHWEGQAPQSEEQIHEVTVEIPLDPGWEVQRVMVCEQGGDEMSIQDGFSNAPCGACDEYPCQCHVEEEQSCTSEDGLS